MSAGRSRRSVFGDDRGASLIDYMVIIVLIAISAIALFIKFGGTMRKTLGAGQTNVSRLRNQGDQAAIRREEEELEREERAVNEQEAAERGEAPAASTDRAAEARRRASGELANVPKHQAEEDEDGELADGEAMEEGDAGGPGYDDELWKFRWRRRIVAMFCIFGVGMGYFVMFRQASKKS